MISEEQLCAQIHDFDEHILAEVYDRYSPEIFRYTMRLLGDSELAEECVAETFHRFLLAIKRGGGPRQYLRAYLYRVAHNWVSDYYRNQNKSALPLDPDCCIDEHKQPPHVFAEESMRRDVRLALSKLTPDQRQVIVLRFLEDWEYPDISRALGKPVGAVKALQHRGLNALRRHLLKEEAMIA